jgi:hypothetical protein
MMNKARENKNSKIKGVKDTIERILNDSAGAFMGQLLRSVRDRTYKKEKLWENRFNSNGDDLDCDEHDLLRIFWEDIAMEYGNISCLNGMIISAHGIYVKYYKEFAYELGPTSAAT